MSVLLELHGVAQGSTVAAYHLSNANGGYLASQVGAGQHKTFSFSREAISTEQAIGQLAIRAQRSAIGNAHWTNRTGRINTLQ